MSSSNQPTSFPRGKRKAKPSSAPSASSEPKGRSRQQQQQPTQQQPADDFLFGSAEPAKRRKTRGRDGDDRLDGHASGPNLTASSLPLGGGSVLPPASSTSGKRIPARIELLSFSRFARGTKVLGCVREVTPDYAVVSLPTMLTGFVRREDGGPPLTDVLPGVNSVMAFWVASTETEQVGRKAAARGGVMQPSRKRRIELSPYPAQVNSGLRLDDYLRGGSGAGGDGPMVIRGRIASVEDHGCLIDTGLASASGGRRRAFLRFENVEPDYEVVDDDGDEEMSDADEESNARDDKGEGKKGARIKLNPGRVYDFAILPSNVGSDASILQLSLPRTAALAKMRTAPSMMPVLSSLQPGMLTEVSVEAYAKNGLCVSFHRGVYRGAIDEDHLGGHRGCEEGKGGKGTKEKDENQGMWWKGVFRGRHSKFTARIVAVDTATKVVRFSIQPHILALRGEFAAFPLPVGTIVEGARVIRIDAGIGALLALPDADGEDDNEATRLREHVARRMDRELGNRLLDNGEYSAASGVRTAYVHISKSMDAPPEKKDGRKKNDRRQQKGAGRTSEALFARHFSVNTRIRSLRILSTSNLIDGIASCATARSIVDAHVLTHADLVPGRLYRDVPVVQLLDGGGVLVDLGVGTRGVIPTMHLFDKASHGSVGGGVDAALTAYRQKVRQAKYRVGQGVDVRCLTVDVRGRTAVLTAKKTLIAEGEDGSVISDYGEAEPGKIAAGFISKVDGTGLTVTFYNNVHGRVSSRCLASELGVEDPRTNYTVGDVVAARVVQCDRRRNRNGDGGYFYQLRLSLKTAVEERPEPSVDEEKADGAAKAREGAVPIAAGSVLAAKRMKVLQLVNCVRRDDGSPTYPGYAVVAVKSKFLVGSRGGDAVEFKLPFDQLKDAYGADLGGPEELDGIAADILTVGKRIDAEGLILSVPVGSDRLPVVTLRPALVETVSSAVESASSTGDLTIACPSPRSNLFMGEYVRGYVTRVDPRYGTFVRFLDGLSGLIPKLKKGLNENLYDTLLCKVTALDITSSPPKILLKRVTEGEVAKKREAKKSKDAKRHEKQEKKKRQPRVGDVVDEVKVVDVNFARAKVHVLNSQYNVRARVHVTMAGALAKTKLSKKERQEREGHKITKSHPFWGWKVGDIITGARIVSVDDRDGVSYVELTNLDDDRASPSSHLTPGTDVSAIVTSVSNPAAHHGLWVQVRPGVSGFVPALELSEDADILNDVAANFPVGSRISCRVMEGGRSSGGRPRRPKAQTDEDGSRQAVVLDLSVLMASSPPPKSDGDGERPAFKPLKARKGDVVAGRINSRIRRLGPPSVMLSLRGGYIGRCCVTEVSDMDEWENLVELGQTSDSGVHVTGGDGKGQQQVVSDSDADHSRENEDGDASDEEQEQEDRHSDFPDGRYVMCRVLGGAKTALDVSMRRQRLDGDLEDDPVPGPNDMVHGYVTCTSKKGCFVRLSRSLDARVILKELSDDFVPDPGAMFPPGRLVVGKVKTVRDSKGGKKLVDIDMRESVLLSGEDRISIDDIEVNEKYTGVVTRVETYGAFVKIDNSDVSGLAHVTECSDSFVKDVQNLYHPGDLVKVQVVSLDREKGNRLAFSLKASNFVDDGDSSDDDDGDEDAMDVDSDSGEVGEDHGDDDDDNSIDSDASDFVAKMAAKMAAGGDVDEDSEDESSSEDDDSDSSGSDSEDDEEEPVAKTSAMDTNVGFDWDTAISSKPQREESSDDDSTDTSSSDEDDDKAVKSSHKSRKKAAARKREEEEISRREAALADGTADESPENAADFERLLASSPNDSEIWIKYMAWHLSLADTDSARNVANRAFDRIEFRQEGEKLNVWTALLTLELKCGTDKSLNDAIDRASQQNNPKQVYLRVCEQLDKEVDAAASVGGSTDLDTATKRADEMFAKACKKFKSKKSVWIAHLQYLLKGSRHEEAHSLLKRSLQSLPQYKHIEVMSKFAQIEFEHGSAERGRTIFDALLGKNPKRMDLLFVYIDKEVKCGDLDKARALFSSVVNPSSSDRKFKFSDKQMKSLFKKWFRMEEEHGDEDSQERVKDEARAFVSNSK